MKNIRNLYGTIILLNLDDQASMSDESYKST